MILCYGVNYMNKLVLFIKKLIFLKPKVVVLDRFTKQKYNWIFKESLKGFEFRGDGNRALIRKYAHILDKGLQYDNQEIGRGKEIYSKLNELLTNIEDKNHPDILWALDISKKYNELQIKGSLDYTVEFKKSEIEFSDYFDFIKSRRSIRYFKNTQVSDYDINRIVSCVNYAPHSCNRQNTKVYFTCDKNKIIECLKVNSGATCLNTPPVFMVITSEIDSYYLPLESNTPFIDASLGAQSMILGAYSAGLSGCVLNWSHATVEEEKTLRTIMGINDNELIIFNFIMGYPLKGAPEPLRKDIENTVVKVC